MKKNSRKFEILNIIINRFLESGEPVGSKTVSELLENQVSSATVRNEMAELAILGYLLKPHVSSGRIPSVQGYRFYVDKLLDVHRLSFEEEKLINEAIFAAMFEPEKFLKRVTFVLAKLTNCIAFSVTKSSFMTKIIEINIIQIGLTEAILILKTDSGMLKSLTFKCDYVLTPEILQVFREILSKKFCGLTLKEVSEGFEEMITDLNNSTTRLLMPIVKALVSVAKQAGEVEVESSGRNNLLKFSEISLENVIKIFEILDSEERMGKIFFEGEYSIGHNLSIFIGDENFEWYFKNITLIATSFDFAGKNGVLGLICPMPVDFSRMSSVLDYISATINNIKGF